MEFEVIDAHVHCGKGYDFGKYLKSIEGTSIKSAIVFPIAGDIYPKAKKDFTDTEEWKQDRERANKYCLSLIKSTDEIKIYPFKFMWNDFNKNNFDKYFGVKWHRRNVDPKYEIASPKFVRLIESLRKRHMPIILEDEFANTIKFINQWSKGINVIIPHLSIGSRSYDQLEKEGVWRRKNIYTDTSYISSVSLGDIKKHIDAYGYRRILFGSDYDFFEPKNELEKILSLNIDNRAKKAILSENILRLLNGVKKPTN